MCDQCLFHKAAARLTGELHLRDEDALHLLQASTLTDCFTLCTWITEQPLAAVARWALTELPALGSKGDLDLAAFDDVTLGALEP